MCGIVGAASERNVGSHLLECLTLLEYRGYNAANMLVVNPQQKIDRYETLNKVAELEKQFKEKPLIGHAGIANTNWARHGKKRNKTMNPRIANDEIALVQNGLIENNEKLRTQLLNAGFELETDTDTELMGYLVYYHMQSGQDFLTAIRSAEKEIEGAFAVCLVHRTDPKSIKALRRGSTLVIGLGTNENFIASDHNALLHVSDRFIYLEEGDIADISIDKITIYDENGDIVKRDIFTTDQNKEKARKGKYSHLMLKEVYDQPDTILTTLQGRLNEQQVFVEAFGTNAPEYFERIHRVQIVGMGTSYHAALVGRYWIEEIAGLPCQVDIASESRYREKIVEPNTLFVTLSQTGETLETLNALRIAKNLGYTATLTIGNAPDSSLVKESDLVLITGEGTNLNMTSIKEFTAQLTALALLALSLGRYHRLDPIQEASLAKKIMNLPLKAQQALKLDSLIKSIAPDLNKQQRALFLGSGIQLPVAMESAMKLKEISSIYAEAHPADEFEKYHLEATDPEIPIVTLAPSKSFFDNFFARLAKHSLNMIVLTDDEYEIKDSHGLKVIKVPAVDKLFSPLIHVIATQLLAYHVAVSKGNDADKMYSNKFESESHNSP